MDLTRIRPTFVEVKLDEIGHNVTELRRLAPAANLMAVVKADGYGHGAIQVAQTALEAGAAWLGVATLEEGVELRKAGITAPILVFGFIPAAQADTLVLYELRATVFHLDLARSLAQWGRALMRRIPIHIKVDSGMGRVGVGVVEALAFVEQVATIGQVEIEGLYTHLAVADEPHNPFTAKQLERFDDLVTQLRDKGIHPSIRHACNSAGLMLHPAGHYELVRAGIALYGLKPDPSVDWPADLHPALTWRTRIGMIKTVEAGTPISYGCTYRAAGRERIASLPVGYADGYFRLLSNRGEVLIGGRRCPIVGRVCMDQTLVRLPDGLKAAVGDEVVLIGAQGNDQIPADEIAGLIGTINYEVTCAINKRVPRVYSSQKA